MKCPVCGAAHLVHDTRDVAYQYKGQLATIHDVTGGHCPACAETVMDEEQCRRYMAEIAAFQREVDASFVEPAYIAQVRHKLGLDLREAADIFGGGVYNFSRYESGKSRPPLALVKLLKILDRHPELLSELMAP